MAEEIGRKIAEELSGQFAKLGLDLLDQQSKLNFAARTHTSLRRSIAVALRGFNDVAPRDFKLNMLWGPDCIIFSFDTTLALTLKVDAAHITLVPAPSNPCLHCGKSIPPEATASSDFIVTQDKQGFHFQRDSASPTPALQGPEFPVLSESQFVDGVLRVACSQPFERHSGNA